jgi:enterochelin esterase-like enzyme
MKFTQLALGLALLVTTVSAQQPPAGPPQPGREGRAGQAAPAFTPAPRSAEVSADGQVTFRLSAPKAAEVVVNGDWENGRGVAMTKDASGVWSVTTPPLAPEIWNYTFSVDGVSMLDPGNYHVVRDGTRYLNSLLVPGPGSALYQTGKVAHGTVLAVWYPSTALQSARRMLVYTPPGYEASTARYPVLYLFHGGGGDEEAWSDMGSTNVIMDNLIAQGRAKPMIVVMPNANWTEPAVLDKGGPRPPTPARGAGGQAAPGAAPAAGGQRASAAARGAAGQAAAGAAPAGQNYDRAEKEIVNDIIPFVEKHYRTLTGRENRAITGLSMGGGISINVGLKRLDVFATVGEFSSGMFGGVGGYAPFDIDAISPGFYKDPAATNKKLRLLYFSCGNEDPRMPFQTKVVEEMRSHKIALTFKGYPGAHQWRVWRDSLADMATMLFK